MHSLCNKLPRSRFRKFSFKQNQRISALTLKFSKWGKYVTTKRCFKQFYKNNVFFKKYHKRCFRSANCYSYCYINRQEKSEVKFEVNKSIDRKSLTWRFLGHPWLWWPKISEKINWNSHFDWLIIVNSGKSINPKIHTLIYFYLVKMIFLQHIARSIISRIIIVNYFTLKVATFLVL